MRERAHFISLAEAEKVDGFLYEYEGGERKGFLNTIFSLLCACVQERSDIMV